MKTALRHSMALITLLGFCLTLVPMGCRGTAGTVDPMLQEVKATTAGSTDDFIVVDCMLPGQVRKLGRMIYQTPRRPVKATRAECEVKGGEYVAYDRSDLDTALAVWMQKAVEGDPSAQTYVGELYQKGLNREPQYDLAAKWYAQAAEKGYARARFNLGYLYEQGLGVEKNPVKALNLYRKASGIEAAVVMESELLKERRQVQELKQELERRQKESDTLRQQLEQTRKERRRRSDQQQSLRQSIQQKAQEIEALRGQLSQLKQYKEEDQVNELLDALHRRTLELNQAQARADALGNEVDHLNRAADEYEAKLAQYTRQSAHIDRLTRDLEQRTQEIEALQKQLSHAQNEMVLIRQTYTREQWLMDQEKARLQKARAQLSALKAEKIDRNQKKVDALSAQILQQESKLDGQRRESARLQSEAQQLAEKIKTYRTQITAAKNQPNALAGPKIQIIDPKLMATRSTPVAPPALNESKREITGKVTAPAGLFYLRVNQKKQSIQSNGLFNLSIPLNKMEDTVIDVVAVDSQGQSDAVSFVVPFKALEKTPPSPSPRKTPVDFGGYHALVIGNDAYENLPALKTAVNDANEIAAVLKQKYGFKTRVLLNADRNEIYTALETYRRELTEKDNFLLYYAGHGELDHKNRRGYWLPVDARADSHINSIPNYTVTDILNIMSVKQALIISDTCYSGIMTRAVVVRQEVGLTGEKRLEWLREIAMKKSRTVLTSGGLMPVLDAGIGDHSIFAKSLLDALTRSKGIVSAEQLYTTIRTEVIKTSDRMGLKQEPQYTANLHAGHESGDFLFVPVELQQS